MSDTDCRKCRSPMPEPNVGNVAAIFGAKFNVTAYRCEKCGHWNDLKRRKKKEPANVNA